MAGREERKKTPNISPHSNNAIRIRISKSQSNEHMHANTVCLPKSMTKFVCLAGTVIVIVCVAQRWLAKYRVWCVFCECIFVFEGVSKTTHIAQYSRTADAIFLLVYTDFMPVFGLCFYFIYASVCVCAETGKKERCVSIARWNLIKRRKMLIDQPNISTQAWRLYHEIFHFIFFSFGNLNIFDISCDAKTKHLSISICISFTFQLDIFAENRRIERKNESKRKENANEFTAQTRWNVNDFDWIFRRKFSNHWNAFDFFSAVNPKPIEFPLAIWFVTSNVYHNNFCLSMISFFSFGFGRNYDFIYEKIILKDVNVHKTSGRALQTNIDSAQMKMENCWGS